MILVHISLDDCDYSCCCPDSLSSLLKSYRQLQFNKIKDQGLSHEFSKWTWHHHLLFQQNVYIFFSWVIFLILWFISSRLWILRNHQLFWMTMTVFTWKYTSSCSHFLQHQISTWTIDQSVVSVDWSESSHLTLTWKRMSLFSRSLVVEREISSKIVGCMWEETSYTEVSFNYEMKKERSTKSVEMTRVVCHETWVRSGIEVNLNLRPRPIICFWLYLW